MNQTDLMIALSEFENCGEHGYIVIQHSFSSDRDLLVQKIIEKLGKPDFVSPKKMMMMYGDKCIHFVAVDEGRDHLFAFKKQGVFFVARENGEDEVLYDKGEAS